MNDGTRILIAEDDATTLEAWCGMIRTWGFQVAGAADGEEALGQLRSFDPHILIADLKMPRLDGLGLLKGMRQLGVNIPTLIISGEGDIPEAVAAIKLGAIDYVRKPIDPPHLRALLNLLARPAPATQPAVPDGICAPCATPALVGTSR